MNLSHTNDLDEIMTKIQQKWGREALRPLANIDTHFDVIPTGFSKLDAMLAIGGIPQNRLTSLYGQLTSGATPLAYSLMAQAQKNELLAVYLDAPHTFDPEYATRHGVDMNLLLLMQPETWERALEILRDTIGYSLKGLLVFDADIDDIALSVKTKALTATLHRVASLLPQTTWTLLVLVPADLPVKVDNRASLRLLLEWQAWLREDDLICGYQVKITVLKNKLASIAEPITVDISLEG